MTREKPILFSGPMVRAILDGRKTQTRRVVKPQPTPYGAPGDKLWVRETWRSTCDNKGKVCIQYRADDSALYAWAADEGTGDFVKVQGATVAVDSVLPWKPSIYMPRWASRITLEVTGVRVERLQDISAGDIIAEGAVDRPHHVEGLGKCPVSAFDGICYPDLRSLWVKGWDSINAKRGYGWGANPWVWVIEFKKV